MKKFTDFRALKDNFGRTGSELYDRFADWAEELDVLLERRVFGGQFQEIMNFCMSLNDTIVTRLSDLELEEQLTICSQYRFTFAQLGSDLDLYIGKLERQYKTWQAKLLMEAKEKVLENQYKLYKSDRISKANISTNKEEVYNQFLVTNELQNNFWNNFIDHTKKARNLVINISEDMKSRSFMIMNLRKKQYQ